MIIRIPIKAVAWQRVKRGAYGQAYKPTKTREYQDLVRGEAMAQYRPNPPMKGRLRILIIFRETETIISCQEMGTAATKIKGDIDNLSKSIQDALNGILWEDDAQIDVLVLRRQGGKD